MDIFVINPGSTSTKLACFTGERELWSETLTHSPQDLARFDRIADQLPWREQAIAQFAAGQKAFNHPFAAVAGRGGLLRPLRGGTYRVNDAMCRDLETARYGEHASNLGALLARGFAHKLGVPAFVVDPPTTDEFDPASRLSGVPGIERKCRAHVLNIKAVARCAATELGKPLAESRFVVAHLGGGISVCALQNGLIVDATDALLGEGPFSLTRAGTLSLEAMLELCFDGGRSKEQLARLLTRECGVQAYLGESWLPAVYEMARAKQNAREVLDAMVRQIAKWIGAMTAVLRGEPHAILLTGGMTYFQPLVEELTAHIGRLAPVRTYPGEREMEALAAGAVRVLNQEEPALDY